MFSIYMFSIDFIENFLEFSEVLEHFFSFLFQSLFNLLEFRRLVLNFSPPANAQDLPRNQKVN